MCKPVAATVRLVLILALSATGCAATPGGNSGGGGTTSGGNLGGGPCKTAADCANSTGVCDVVGGKCVQCMVSAQCGAATPLCSHHVCVAAVPCTSDKQCGASNQVCDSDAGFCTDCKVDTDCDPLTQKCAAGVCQTWAKCTSSKDCASLGLVCNDGRCADCETLADCKAGEACFEGNCAPQKCEPGKPACIDLKTVGMCDSEGTSISSEGTKCQFGLNYCLPGKGCKDTQCRPNSLWCKGPTTLVQCGPDGSLGATVQTCETSAPCGVIIPEGCTSESCVTAGCNSPAPCDLYQDLNTFPTPMPYGYCHKNFAVRCESYELTSVSNCGNHTCELFNKQMPICP